MEKRTLEVTASSDDEAIQSATIELSCTPDDVKIMSKEKSNYVIEVLNADALLDIEISEDHMVATITGFHAEVGTGKALTEESVIEQLKHKNVYYGVDKEAVHMAVEFAGLKRKLKGIILAMGTQPSPPESAQIEINGDLRFPVFPGDIICTKTPAKEAENGVTVSGEELEPPKSFAKIHDVSLSPKKGAILSEDGMSVKSTTYGLANVSNGNVRVDDLFYVSDDLLIVKAAIYIEDYNRGEITPEKLKKSMEQFEFKYGFDEESVKGAIEKLKEKIAEFEADKLITNISEEEKQPENTAGEEKAKTGFIDLGSSSIMPSIMNVVIMKGKPAIDGEDAKLQLFFEEEKEVGEVERDGRIDFKERHTVRNAIAGQELGHIVPETQGEAGVNVKGEEIPAIDGEPMDISIGENITTSPDGLTFSSDIDGIIIYTPNHISVTDMLEVNGDVNYSTGNIHIEKGSLVISGSICTGFCVEVEKSIIVNEAIEGAEVKAGGDIEVKHGIIMAEKGLIEAKGFVKALFAENATIKAEGDVNISNDANNCEIEAGGKIILTEGKGKIMGGTIKAAEGVEANEIGSDMGIATTIIIGKEPEGKKELLEEQNVLTQNVKKIEKAIGIATPEEVLKHTPPTKRKAVAQVIKAKMAAMSRIKDIEKIIEEIDEKCKEANKATVNVHKSLHPGTKVFIAGTSFSPTKEISACKLKYDKESDQIRILPL